MEIVECEKELIDLNKCKRCEKHEGIEIVSKKTNNFPEQRNVICNKEQELQLSDSDFGYIVCCPKKKYDRYASAKLACEKCKFFKGLFTKKDKYQHKDVFHIKCKTAYKKIIVKVQENGFT